VTSSDKYKSIALHAEVKLAGVCLVEAGSQARHKASADLLDLQREKARHSVGWMDGVCYSQQPGRTQGASGVVMCGAAHSMEGPG
jgi:hypothetical protein